MASDHTHTVEFFIEVYPTSDFESDDEAEHLPKLSVKPTNGIRRSQRCWSFPNWRLRRAAVAANGLEEMEECVQLGADVDSKDSNARTALHEAAKAGNVAAAAYLVSQGADINARDDHGSTPLVEAVRFNNNGLARLLVAKRHGGEATRDGNEFAVMNSSFWIILLAFLNRVWLRKHDLVKWFIVVANVGLELCQAVVSEEAGDGGNHSRDLAAGLSLICLVMSVAEVGYEAKKKGAKWRKRRGRYCFYYYLGIGIRGLVFGSFTLWFGLISSTVQFALNAVTLVVGRVVVKFDYLALLLAICLLLVACMKGEDDVKKMKGAVKCVVHGESEAKGGFKPGIWMLPCH